MEVPRKPNRDKVTSRDWEEQKVAYCPQAGEARDRGWVSRT
jgi:hypothetical protein